MENLPEDQKIVDLLTKLKNSNGAYPSDMLAARRKTYLRQMANVGLGLGIGAGLGQAAKGGNGAGVAASTVASKVLETVLIAAIVIEAGTVAYLYRDKIAEAVSALSGAPAVQEVASPSEEPSGPVLEIEATETPVVTVSETPSVIPSGSPSLELAGEDDQNGDHNGPGNTGANGGVSVNATPDPGGNQGNQYGLTPKPERTKENSGSGGGTNNGGGGNSSDGGGGGGNNNGNGGGNNKP